MSDIDYEFVSLDELRTPRGGLQHVYIDYWWAVHPTKGALFYCWSPKSQPSPICNSNKAIVESRLEHQPDSCEVMQIPLVFVAHRCDP